MCTYYYLHYHHVAPCAKGVEYDVQYAFCENSTIEAVVGGGDSPLRPAVSTGTDTGMSMDMNMNMNINMGMSSGYNNNNSSRSSPVGGIGEEQQEPQVMVQQQPCEHLTPAPEHSPALDMGMGMGTDYANSCATGGCLESQHCASGGCRLDELGGRWVCCRCGRGGNAFRWCVHSVRKVPDTLCYHVVCRDCRADS